jgi:P27 family predicted phage terminase small subunit
VGGIGSGKLKAKKGSSERLYAPVWLPGEARNIFSVLARQLEGHALQKADTLALALLSQWVWINKLALQEVVDKGILEEDSAHSKDPENPEMRKNPAISVARASTTLIGDIAKQFGMSPAARARLGLEEGAGGPSLAEILRPKQGLKAMGIPWVVGDPEDGG